MKMIPSPPPDALVWKNTGQLMKLMELAKNPIFNRHYLHWDKLRYHKVEGYTAEEMWSAAKIQRMGTLKPVPLRDTKGNPFKFSVPELVAELLHEIDMGAGATIGVPEPITNPQTKKQYLIRSLMEEAITSSQLEGAATTRDVAKEMIRSGRKPRDIGEQMIFNNYLTMQRIAKLKDEPLSP